MTTKCFYRNEENDQWDPRLQKSNYKKGFWFNDAEKILWAEVPRGFMGADWYGFDYDDIVDFTMNEDGQTITKGGLGSAAGGALLFGPAGAVVGAIVGKKSHDVCESLSITITTKDSVRPTVSHLFLDTKTKKSSGYYKNALTEAQECASKLTQVISSVQATGQPIPTSNADEIMKMKQLLDCGAITQEEFEEQKRKLLN